MNQNTCITIDVSQEKSHIQGFIGPNKPLSKARSMRHTKQGFQFILTLKDLIKSKTNENPLIIFEYTGIYHKTLEKFLISQNLNYHIVAPLRAAKARNSEIRAQKTDARDCLSLSKMFYNNDLGDFYSEDETYYNLRKLNRYYDTCMIHLIKTKVNFREILSILYPNYKKIFTSIYSNESLTFLKLFPHPSMFTNKSEDEIIELLCNNDNWDHLEGWTKDKVKKITPIVNEIVSGCSINDFDVNILLMYIDQIEMYLTQIKNTINKMHELAKELPLFNLVHSLPGIQDILTCKFIAELGDISRFTNHKQIVAYAGIDPVIRQSGNKDGLHLKIAKKGNKRLRTILYLMVSSLIKSNRQPNAIKTKYQKKTHQLNPLKPKVASIACANQLVRIIFYMHKTSSTYKYEL